MNEGLIWFLFGLAVGIAGTTLFLGVSQTRRRSASIADQPTGKGLAASVDLTGRTGGQKVVASHRSAFRIGTSDIEIDGVHYRSLDQVPDSTRGLVADELRVARDLLPPDGPQRAVVDAFLDDQRRATAEA